MKKFLRASLLCFLLLAVILTVSACLDAQTPEETTPQTTTQNVTTPEGTTPEATTPETTTPEVTTPEATTPETTTPEVTTPEVTTPEVTTPEVTTPEVTTPEVTTPEATTPEATTPEATTPEELPDPDKPEGAVLVESVNGKNAHELLTDFANAFTTTTSYDWSAEMIMSDGDFSMTQTISMKLSGSEFAFVMEMDGEAMEIYFVDDVLYMNSFGTKMRIPADSIDEVLGEDTLESFISMSQDFELSDAELAAAADVNIYLLNGEYIITVHYINEDTEMEETSVFYFNAAGELTVAKSYTDEGIAILTLYSYNKPVTVTPPADADEYIDFSQDNNAPELPETEDEIYALYESICTTLQEYESYTVDIWTADLYFSYEVAEEDKYIAFMDGESWIEQCIIDQIGYIRIDYGENIETSLNEEYLEPFASVEALLPINVLAKNDLQNLRCSYDEDWGEIVIEFEYAGKNNTLTQYKYAIEENGSYIDITVTEIIGGIEGETYSFFFVEDPTLEIKLPMGK